MLSAVLHVTFLFRESHFEDRLVAVGHGRLAFFLEHRKVRKVHSFLPDDQHIMSGRTVTGALLRSISSLSSTSPEKSNGNCRCRDTRQESLLCFHRSPPKTSSSIIY